MVCGAAVCEKEEEKREKKGQSYRKRERKRTIRLMDRLPPHHASHIEIHFANIDVSYCQMYLN